ncbi:MAG: TRCF domain-containing protein, partial [Chloroflexota bacterium]
GQVYIVHNKVATIDAMAERIRQLIPEARLVVAHGQMEGAQLEGAMLTFAHGEADILLSSTIIENGLDIPNVNTIIINNAHRLGLTQLYQLRGRVGRSANQAYAYLLYPRDVRLSVDASRRLEAIFEAHGLGAGFSIAMKDLEIRGAGNLLGAQQSGHAAAVGFDLYTRMVGDAVEKLRGTSFGEPPSITIDLPLDSYLPAEYIGDETQRLTLYRRLAAVSDDETLVALREEIQDRFGALPGPLVNLLNSLHLKLMASKARINSISLSSDFLVIRAEPGAIFDRISLHKRFGNEARISTNVLRLPRRALGVTWFDQLQQMVLDMIRLRATLGQPRETADDLSAAQHIVPG